MKARRGLPRRIEDPKPEIQDAASREASNPKKNEKSAD
jgi:hypothetical protein